MNKFPTVISNFISESQINELVELIDSLDKITANREDDSRTLVWNSDDPKAINFIKNEYPKILSKAGLSELMPHIVGFYRYNPGAGLAVHSDIMNPTCNDCKLSAIVYLNDDYSGGEIYFPKLDIEIRPKSGDLIFYPSYDGDFDHGVRPILDGFRYAIPMCLTTNNMVACKYYL